MYNQFGSPSQKGLRIPRHSTPTPIRQHQHLESATTTNKFKSSNLNESICSSTNRKEIDHDKRVKVFIRIRPQHQEASAEVCNDGTLVKIQGLNQTTIQACTKEKTETFPVDGVLDENMDQEKVFEMIGKPVVEQFLTCNNAAIFGYGHTGSGKTYTIGTTSGELNIQADNSSLSESAGLLPRIIHQLITSGTVLECSLVEIYNNFAFDLLKDREKISQSASVLENASRASIGSLSDLSIISKGLNIRQTAPNGMNEVSSRSHCIFTLYKKNENGKTSFLSMVDLAGSETQSVEKTLCFKEASYINLSLLALKRCIYEMTEKSDYIPFRDSTLTQTLKPVFCGNSRIFFIGNVTQSGKESVETLNYSQTVKNIKKTVERRSSTLNKMFFNQKFVVFSGIESEIEKQLLFQAQQEVHSKQEQIEKLTEQIEILEKKQESTNMYIEQMEQLRIEKENWERGYEEREKFINGELLPKLEMIPSLSKENLELKTQLVQQTEILKIAEENFKKQIDDIGSSQQSISFQLDCLKKEMVNDNNKKLKQTLEKVMSQNQTLLDQLEVLKYGNNGMSESQPIDLTNLAFKEIIDITHSDDEDEEEEEETEFPVQCTKRKRGVSIHSTDESPNCKYKKTK